MWLCSLLLQYLLLLLLFQNLTHLANSSSGSATRRPCWYCGSLRIRRRYTRTTRCPSILRMPSTAFFMWRKRGNPPDRRRPPSKGWFPDGPTTFRSRPCRRTKYLPRPPHSIGRCPWSLWRLLLIRMPSRLIRLWCIGSLQVVEGGYCWFFRNPRVHFWIYLLTISLCFPSQKETNLN